MEFESGSDIQFGIEISLNYWIYILCQKLVHVLSFDSKIWFLLCKICYTDKLPISFCFFQNMWEEIILSNPGISG